MTPRRDCEKLAEFIQGNVTNIMIIKYFMKELGYSLRTATAHASNFSAIGFIYEDENKFMRVNVDKLQKIINLNTFK